MVGLATRIVTHVRTNKYGEITHICNPTASWIEVKIEEAISQVSSMMYQYSVKYNDIQIPLKVIKNPDGKKMLKPETDTVSLYKLPGMY